MFERNKKEKRKKGDGRKMKQGSTQFYDGRKSNFIPISSYINI